MIIARIESLILEAGLDDAISRARTYVEAGADGIMIHSREKTPKSVFEFARIFRLDFPSVPLVCVPTTYSQVSETELSDNGFNIVIYANHMLRASYPAMARTAEAILSGGRALEAEELIAPIQHLLDFIPGTR
jgi:phosphoenolpyruvate phosphomutase